LLAVAAAVEQPIAALAAAVAAVVVCELQLLQLYNQQRIIL